MRIGFNAQILTDGRTGVTCYARNVVRLLPKIGKEHEFIIFGNSPDLHYDENNVKVIITPQWINTSSKRIIWEQIYLPLLVKKYKIDIMFYPDHTASFFLKKIKQAIMVHDLAPFTMADTFHKMRRIYKQKAINYSINSAKIVFVNSFFTKSEVVRYFPNIKNKINIVHLGLEKSIERISDEALLADHRKKYSLKEPVILFVGTIETRKNIIRLIRAFAKGKRTYGWQHSLLLVGMPGHGFNDIQKEIFSNKIQDFVKISGYVQENELSIFYSLADIFVYPSLYEGFGFPPLEAMRCGCPVIVSNSTSIPEVVGDAGLYVDPYNESSITEQINLLINNSNLKKELVEKGYKRSLQFTWEKTVSSTLEVLESL